MRFRSLGTLLFCLLLAGCASVAAEHAPRVTAIGTSLSAARALELLAQHPVPGRNLYLLTQEYRLHPPHAVSAVVRTSSPNYPVGHQDTFWVFSEDKLKYFRVRATIRAETPHLYLYVADDTHPSQTAIEKEAKTFEQMTYPTDHAFFGTEWTPGVDGDPHITCLYANLRSSLVAGFFSAEDEYPPVVNPYSNAREMFYINTNTPPGSGDFAWTLAHEFQHMIHWHMHPRDNAWLNEGMSMLAQRVNGYKDSVLGEVFSFMDQPGTQLNTWEEANLDSHYGASYLFLAYIYDRFGRGVIHDMVADSRYTDLELLNDVLRKHHIHETAAQVFADWAVANYVDDRSVGAGQGAPSGSSSYGRYVYVDLPNTLTPPPSTSVPFSLQGSLAPYASKYVLLGNLSQQKPFQLHFSAPATVPLVGTPGTASFWWGNRGDLIDSNLTRTVDLRHVQTAHLHFKVWYDIEKGYDFGYVSVSQDGGHTWKTVRTANTTSSNPSGYSYGNSFTGESSGWLSQTADLSAYAGHRIKIRFEYITDDALNLQGMAVRSITIPEIGFKDNFTGWDARGFLPVTSNRVPVSWTVQLVETTDSGTRVQQMKLDAAQRGTVTIDPAALHLNKLTVVITSAATKTTVHSTYQLSATVP